MDSVKQVIVIRKDLKMRRGKEIAQGAHASMAFLSNLWAKNLAPSAVERQWLEDSFTKVVCQAQSEDELLDLAAEAERSSIQSHLIQDQGRTEFGGVPTYTALALGPDWSEELDAITGHLKLY